MPRLARPLPHITVWVCPTCHYVDPETPELKQARYRCARCEMVYDRRNGAGAWGKACPRCGEFGAKIANDTCRECGANEATLIVDERYVCPVCPPDPVLPVGYADHLSLADHLLDEHFEFAFEEYGLTPEPE